MDLFILYVLSVVYSYVLIRKILTASWTDNEILVIFTFVLFFPVVNILLSTFYYFIEFVVPAVTSRIDLRRDFFRIKSGNKENK